jgi:antitoxin (DNA-binding transcriptional repressor) of toxin-antitoxin stability system
MAIVKVSELRQNLATYLARAQQGETIQVAVHGEVVARIEGEPGAAEAARARIAALHGNVVLAEVLSPLAERWQENIPTARARGRR